MVAYSCGLDQNLLLQKNPVTMKKKFQTDENTANNCYLYAQISQKLKVKK